ncbi:hypothetical protein [Streptomyces sp. NL15-2K]|uniref:hypothetical protein n=1 Tax=Streptomyces sp. NL15-2K TaxID=376149 RepID=UPI000F587C33|nr:MULTISPECIES: hypothetical protein [Actinomycetes]WKX06162.1 hypothetical protein Q4V64_01140 [Kutzneria buriramensis]GCB53464.1 beta-glucosidase [Streptomyces sp. NL15-2K]
MNRPSDTLEARLDAAVSRLSLEAKVRLLTGESLWTTHPEPAEGLRRITVSDGPAGVRGTSFDAADTSASLPSPTALAASFDEDLIRRLGVLLASEARGKVEAGFFTVHAARHADASVLRVGVQPN